MHNLHVRRPEKKVKESKKTLKGNNRRPYLLLNNTQRMWEMQANDDFGVYKESRHCNSKPNEPTCNRVVGVNNQSKLITGAL
jgi:hypothetical protein